MTNRNPDLTATAKLPTMTMADLVFGPRPVKRAALPTRLILVAALLSASLGCAHAPSAPAPAETVGELAQSYHSIASAPVHHDAPPEMGQIVESGDDGAADVATTVTRTPDPDADVTPDVAPKTDGIKVGEAR